MKWKLLSKRCLLKKTERMLGFFMRMDLYICHSSESAIA
ncbi:hypothetical protein PSEUDO9AG_50828 [Pseudomonas sp. 9Ag]|nr:hypothetical protein PSEUDO9AG_50828 [Pseudomonas sp. 9Ag]